MMEEEKDNSKQPTATFLTKVKRWLIDKYLEINWGGSMYLAFILGWPLILTFLSMVNVISKGFSTFFVDFIPYFINTVINKKPSNEVYEMEPWTNLILLTSFVWLVVVYARDDMREREAKMEKRGREEKEKENKGNLEDLKKLNREHTEALRRQQEDSDRRYTDQKQSAEIVRLSQEKQYLEIISKNQENSKTLEENKVQLLNYLHQQEIKHSADIQRVYERVSGQAYFDIFAKATKYYNTMYKSFYALNQFDQQFYSGNYKEISRIKKTLIKATIASKYIVKDFFEITDCGVNLMIYFDLNEDYEVIQKLINTVPGFGIIPDIFVNETSHYLEGVLYLPDELNIPLVTSKISSSLILPIYTVSRGNTKMFDDSITIPGAPRAFFVGNSTIKNTQELFSFYELNYIIRDQAMQYFRGMIDTKSLLSLRIPEKHPEESKLEDCLAIFNIEAPKPEVFHRDDHRHDAFYSFIYPTMKTASKYLKHYKNYLRETILSQ